MCAGIIYIQCKNNEAVYVLYITVLFTFFLIFMDQL